ncbi:hypothetical protein GGTG_06812, partial [Gaeumannomyces tritici R3-111a-1]
MCRILGYEGVSVMDVVGPGVTVFKSGDRSADLMHYRLQCLQLLRPGYIFPLPHRRLDTGQRHRWRRNMSASPTPPPASLYPISEGADARLDRSHRRLRSLSAWQSLWMTLLPRISVAAATMGAAPPDEKTIGLGRSPSGSASSDIQAGGVISNDGGAAIVTQYGETKRGLSPRHAQLMAIGGSIGTGLYHDL